MAVSIATTLSVVMKQLTLLLVPIVVYTDSLSLYDYLVKLGTTKEKRLMIDIMALREAYERGNVDDVRWINGRDNPADLLTKAKVVNPQLTTFVNNNEVTMRV